MEDSRDTVFDTIVVGGGPAGYTAALYAARAGLSVLVLEKLTPGGQMGTTDQIDNYPGFPEGIGGFELAMQMKQGAERFGAKTKVGSVTAASLEGPVKEITAGKKAYQAKTVIFATGAHPRELGLPGERELRGKGVSYCATCDGMFFRGKAVAVVGGGNTAAADALYLSRLCESVTVIHRRDTLRAAKVYRGPLEQAGNIRFMWDSEITALQYDSTLTGVQVRHKKTGETQALPCAGLFVAIGQVPNTELLAGKVPLDQAGYVLADETTRTGIPGVFVAGDMRAKHLRQVVTACADGAVAAQFAEEYISM